MRGKKDCEKRTSLNKYGWESDRSESLSRLSSAKSLVARRVAVEMMKGGEKGTLSKTKRQ
jgi:hypothetical protein